MSNSMLSSLPLLVLMLSYFAEALLGIWLETHSNLDDILNEPSSLLDVFQCGYYVQQMVNIGATTTSLLLSLIYCWGYISATQVHRLHRSQLGHVS